MKAWQVGAIVGGVIIVGAVGITFSSSFLPSSSDGSGTLGYAPMRVDEPPPPPKAGDDLLALLDHLSVGDKLGTCEVKSIEGVQNGRARVIAAKDEASVSLEIVKLAEKGQVPPATTELYGIFYNVSRGDGVRQLPISVIEEAAKALGKRIEKNEKTVAAPAGMGSSDIIEERRGVAM